MIAIRRSSMQGCRALGRWGLALLAAVPVLLSAQVATGQSGASGSDREEARRLFAEGVAAAKADRWEEARDRFERSYRASPAPLTLFNLAGAQRNTGRLVAAGESYRLFLRQASGARHQAFRRAAENELAELERLTPVVEVHAPGALRSDEIAIDGEPVDAQAAQAGIASDPGRHVVSVRRSGRVIAQRPFEIAAAQRLAVQVRVPLPALSPRVGRAEPAILAPTRPAEPPARRRSLWRSPWLWAAAVAVAAGAGATGYLVYDSRRGSGGDPTRGTLGDLRVP